LATAGEVSESDAGCPPKRNALSLYSERIFFSEVARKEADFKIETQRL
jgi:hypothetical protein